MPEGLLEVVALLSLGYVLLLLELFVPGGILGVLGVLCIGYGCTLAFGLGTSWGLGAMGLSLTVTGIGLAVFLRSRAARRLVLEGPTDGGWQAPDAGLRELLGASGTTLSPLRPAGLVDIAGERVDVVADDEFLDAGVRVRVCEVEGNRVVVEPVADDTAEVSADGEAPP